MATKYTTTQWISFILQGIISVMFLMGAVMNISGSEEAVKGATDIGYPASSVLYLGLILLVSTLLYIYPKTILLGAILLTGWLGGAVATHIIHGDSLGMTFMPVVFGVIVWLAYWLRSSGLKGLLPF